MNNKILLVAGDPISINSEIIFKSWRKLNTNSKKNIYLIGNYKLITKQLSTLKYRVKTIKLKSINDNIDKTKLNILDVSLKFSNPFKIPKKNLSEYVVKSLELAHVLAIKNKIKGIINCPVDKKLLKNTKKTGVTEFLAAKCKILNNSEVMLIHNKNFSVAPITTHIKLKDVSKKINKKLIINKILSLNKNFKKIFKKKPKIGILGLNPHNSELEKNSEEIKILKPSISKLKKNGLKIDGPLISDTLFIKNFKKYDVVVGMYHDQVLTPFKTLYQFDAINITLGLKYLRVSPDHGTAVDIIGKNSANFHSLLKCIKFLNNLR